MEIGNRFKQIQDAFKNKKDNKLKKSDKKIKLRNKIVNEIMSTYKSSYDSYENNLIRDRIGNIIKSGDLDNPDKRLMTILTTDQAEVKEKIEELFDDEFIEELFKPREGSEYIQSKPPQPGTNEIITRLLYRLERTDNLLTKSTNLFLFKLKKIPTTEKVIQTLEKKIQQLESKKKLTPIKKSELDILKLLLETIEHCSQIEQKGINRKTQTETAKQVDSIDKKRFSKTESSNSEYFSIRDSAVEDFFRED